jgi:hypothetical protein
LIKNMMEDHKNRLSEQVATLQEAKDDESNHPLPAVPSDTESDDQREEQVLRDGELAITLATEERRKVEEQERAAEEEARRKEQDAVNEKLQQILRMLENAPEPGPSPQAKSTERESSGDEENIVKMTMKHASDKKADREARRKDLDTILKPPPTPHNPYADIAALRAGVSRLKITSKNSGNVNTSTVYGSHNDNSTVTRISKGGFAVLSSFFRVMTDVENSQMSFLLDTPRTTLKAQPD